MDCRVLQREGRANSIALVQAIVQTAFRLAWVTFSYDHIHFGSLNDSIVSLGKQLLDIGFNQID